jgi:hypothetical protein
MMHGQQNANCFVFKYRSLYYKDWFTAGVSNTGRFIMFSVITNIYNKKTKGPTLMEWNRMKSIAH